MCMDDMGHAGDMDEVPPPSPSGVPSHLVTGGEETWKDKQAYAREYCNGEFRLGLSARDFLGAVFPS